MTRTSRLTGALCTHAREARSNPRCTPAVEAEKNAQYFSYTKDRGALFYPFFCLPTPIEGWDHPRLDSSTTSSEQAQKDQRLPPDRTLPQELMTATGYKVFAITINIGTAVKNAESVHVMPSATIWQEENETRHTVLMLGHNSSSFSIAPTYYAHSILFNVHYCTLNLQVTIQLA